MLLVITPSAKALGCAQAIQPVTSEEAHVVATSSQALAQLRAREYVAVLIDQAFLETEPVESDMVLKHMGTAVPVYLNFAISNMDRVARELRAALVSRAKPRAGCEPSTKLPRRCASSSTVPFDALAGASRRKPHPRSATLLQHFAHWPGARENPSRTFPSRTTMTQQQRTRSRAVFAAVPRSPRGPLCTF
jgi:hypothetical protein